MIQKRTIFTFLVLTQMICTACADKDQKFQSPNSRPGYLLEDNTERNRQAMESGDSGLTDRLNYDVFKEHYKNGKAKREINFSGGKLHGRYITWFENGQKQKEINYRLGLRDGLTKEWYRSGQLKEKSNYVDGNVNGTYQGWHENGNKSFEANYLNGKLNGRLNRWTNNQNLISKQHFEDGLLVLDQ